MSNRYASGQVMSEIRAAKEETWKKYAALEYFSPDRWKSSNTFSACDKTTGKASVAGLQYRCKNLDVTGYLSHEDLGSTYPGSSIWGVTLRGREFVAIGQSDGTAFAEIVGTGPWNAYGKQAGTLDYIGRLPYPKTSEPSMWKEIKSYKHYAVIGSEADGHGVQLFDMHKLLALRHDRLSTETKVFNPETDASVFTGLPTGRSHNVVIAEASNHVIAVGARPRTSTCLSGLIFINVTDVNNPTQSGCADQDGYVHDAQCLIYHGPDVKYEGREICYGYNENSIAIYDITNKARPYIISNTTYHGASYTHQGWVLDPNNQEYLLLDDELDEVYKAGKAFDQHATTYILNIKSLEKPFVSGYYKSAEVSIDHNQYIAKGFTYQSNYAAGLRILDISSIPEDPSGGGIEEVAYFDVFPEDDDDPRAVYMGTWANTGGFFKSGHAAINTIDRGVFVVKRSKTVQGGYRAEF
ncbi:hypothetical protein BDD12DRAFT_915108 [Trichophaea hybrida]|nr:hypothetical protein BDD12DRAFT_915108 [Trichophaea hybrida]